MVERIKEIILKEGMTSGSYADLIGVQRSSMSHILNGRNNPSLDFIVKTLQAFPKINPDWLLSGNGPMYRDQVQETVKEKPAKESAPKEPSKSQPAPPPPPPAQPAPAENAPKPVRERSIFESLPEQAPRPEPVQPPVVVEKQVVVTKGKERFVDKVMIFYNDHTYDEFVNAHKTET